MKLYGVGREMSMEDMTLTVLQLDDTSPGACSAYVLAQQMGGDAPYSAGDITASTMFCFITIPFWLWLLG